MSNLAYKSIIIINGKGGTGKDTLMEAIDKNLCKIKIVSSIDKIKEIARENGWNGEKDLKGRKFLADLKKAFTEYDDLPTKWIVNDSISWIQDKNDESKILFIVIREPENIKKYIDLLIRECDCKEVYLDGFDYRVNLHTLLIKRKSLENKIYGNSSDDNVEDFNYNFEFNNDKSLEESVKDFIEFTKAIIS